MWTVRTDGVWVRGVVTQGALAAVGWASVVTVMVQFRSATGAALAGAAGTRSTPVARASSARYRTGRRGRRIMFPPAGWAVRADVSRDRRGRGTADKRRRW